MTSPASTRPTREQGMKFAFTLAAVVSVLSAVLAWRRYTLAAEVTFVLGALLLAAGLAFPTRLASLYRVLTGRGRRS